MSLFCDRVICPELSGENFSFLPRKVFFLSWGRSPSLSWTSRCAHLWAQHRGPGKWSQAGLHTASMPHSYTYYSRSFFLASALCLTVCDPLEPVRGREGGPLTGGEDESVTCTVEDVMIAPGDSWVWCACYWTKLLPKLESAAKMTGMRRLFLPMLS